jgi:hypothetical protein
MKKLLFTTLLTMLMSGVVAQSILDVRFDPAYPGPADSVRAIIDLEFTTGDCQMSSGNFSVNNDSIRIEVAHCPGPLNFICYVTDTINLGVLPPGTYATNVVLRKGNYFSADPCAGSSLVDSVHNPVIVYLVSGLDETPDHADKLIYNPADGTLDLISSITESSELKVYNVQGAVVLEETIKSGKKLNAGSLKAGVYLYTLTKREGNIISGKLLVN